MKINKFSNYFLLFCLTIIISSCAEYKVTYVDSKVSKSDHQHLDGYLNKNQSSLKFSSYFIEEPIIVRQFNRIIFEGNITTDNLYSRAKILTIEEGAKLEISFPKTEVDIVIGLNDLAKYKFIEISKKDNKLFARLSNIPTKSL